MTFSVQYLGDLSSLIQIDYTFPNGHKQICY